MRPSLLSLRVVFRYCFQAKSSLLFRHKLFLPPRSQASQSISTRRDDDSSSPRMSNLLPLDSLQNRYSVIYGKCEFECLECQPTPFRPPPSEVLARGAQFTNLAKTNYEIGGSSLAFSRLLSPSLFAPSPCSWLAQDRPAESMQSSAGLRSPRRAESPPSRSGKAGSGYTILPGRASSYHRAYPSLSIISALTKFIQTSAPPTVQHSICMISILGSLSSTPGTGYGARRAISS